MFFLLCPSTFSVSLARSLADFPLFSRVNTQQSAIPALDQVLEALLTCHFDPTLPDSGHLSQPLLWRNHLRRHLLAVHLLQDNFLVSTAALYFCHRPAILDALISHIRHAIIHCGTYKDSNYNIDSTAVAPK